MKKVIKLKIKTSISSLFLLSLLISIYLSPLFEGFFNTTILRPVFFLISYCFAITYFIINRKTGYNREMVFFTILGATFLLLSAISAFNFSGLKSYNGFITTFFIISIDYQKFLKYLKVIFIVCFVLALYEFFTKEFIYEVSRIVDGKLVVLDEVFFRGWAKIFRAKGIFEGPLSLTQFAIAMSIIYKDNFKIVIACLIMSIIANGRLGILLTAILLLIYIIRKYGLIKFILSKKFIAGSLFIVGAIAFLISKMKQSSIDRIFNVFNLQEKANQGRFHYWLQAIEEFVNYDLVHIIFGNQGYYRATQGNSAENGWLMILLDGGLLGFLFYFAPVLLLSIISIYKKTGHFLYLAVIFMAMFVQTFHSGASANLLYWMIMFMFFLELTNSHKLENK